MSVPTQLYLIGSGAIVLWLVAFGVSLLFTRNGTVEPGPATQEFGPGPEPAAVVALLGNQWRSVRHAAAATLLDLAARGLVELRQPGDDPAHTTVHLTAAAHAATAGVAPTGVAPSGDTPAPVAALAPYERRVLARVVAQAGNGGAPIGAIAFRAADRAVSWNKELSKEIIADARLRGLSRPRFGKLLNSVLLLATFVPGVLFALAVVIGGHAVRAAYFVGATPVVVLGVLLSLAMTERATRAGLARAGHWAGLRAWLLAHEDFAQLPPAAVTVWDRYLAYGTALGVTSRTSRLLGFDAGDRRRVWSSYGGTWRQVRVRYPRLHFGFGGSTKRLLQLAGAAAVVAVGLALFAVLRRPEWAVTSGPDAETSLRRPGLLLSFGWAAIAMLALAAAGKFRRWTLLLVFLGTLVGAWAAKDNPAFQLDGSGPLPGEWVVIFLFGLLTGWYLALVVRDRQPPQTITGEVLRLEAGRGRHGSRFLALDEGTSDRATAWALPTLAPDYAPGTVLRLTVSPATRSIRTASIVKDGADLKSAPIRAV